MGMSKHILGVFYKLAVDGEFKKIRNVIELGAQGIVCGGYE